MAHHCGHRGEDEGEDGGHHPSARRRAAVDRSPPPLGASASQTHAVDRPLAVVGCETGARFRSLPLDHLGEQRAQRLDVARRRRAAELRRDARDGYSELFAGDVLTTRSHLRRDARDGYSELFAGDVLTTRSHLRRDVRDARARAGARRRAARAQVVGERGVAVANRVVERREAPPVDGVDGRARLVVARRTPCGGRAVSAQARFVPPRGRRSSPPPPFSRLRASARAIAQQPVAPLARRRVATGRGAHTASRRGDDDDGSKRRRGSRGATDHAAARRRAAGPSRGSLSVCVISLVADDDVATAGRGARAPRRSGTRQRARAPRTRRGGARCAGRSRRR